VRSLSLLAYSTIEIGRHIEEPACDVAKACGTENKQVASVRMPLSSGPLHARILSGVAGMFIQTQSLDNAL
jgi:hypothetical protein